MIIKIEFNGKKDGEKLKKAGKKLLVKMLQLSKKAINKLEQKLESNTLDA